MEQQASNATERLWGARFKSQPSAALKALSRSEPSFFRLVPYDLAGSRARAEPRMNKKTSPAPAQVCPAARSVDAGSDRIDAATKGAVLHAVATVASAAGISSLFALPAS